jgi:hypothetical protein
MNKTWYKPKGFNKPMRAAWGVKKVTIAHNMVNKVRNFTHRWNEEEAGLADNAGVPQ